MVTFGTLQHPTTVENLSNDKRTSESSRGIRIIGKTVLRTPQQHITIILTENRTKVSASRSKKRQSRAGLRTLAQYRTVVQ